MRGRLGFADWRMQCYKDVSSQGISNQKPKRMFPPGLDKLILEFIRMRKCVAIAEKTLTENNKEGLLSLISKRITKLQ